MIILDTDIMIDLLRKYPPAIAWLTSLGDEEIALNQKHYTAIANLQTVQPYTRGVQTKGIAQP